MEYQTKPVGTSQSHVVVIHCSDPRYQPHFQDFLYSGLRLSRYGLIAIPGGPEHLSPSERSDALRSQGAAWFDFMSKLMAAERCILIGHADCRWYIANRIESDESRLKEHVSRDLIAAREEIQRRFPNLRVELYFAEIEGEQATFTEVAEPALTSEQPARYPR
jgi:hypothetical protein